MIDKTILLNPVTMTCVENMFDETAMLMPTVLVCPTTGCTLGNGGACGEPRPSLRMLPCNIWSTTKLLLMANRSMGEVWMFVMMALVKLFMMEEMKINYLGGQSQTQISKRYRAQCSKEDVVRKTSISSEGSG